VSRQRLYVFLTRRPQDKQAWPLVYSDRELAIGAPHRVSEVVPVMVDERPAPETKLTPAEEESLRERSDLMHRPAEY
jgi:hypothetical protein